MQCLYILCDKTIKFICKVKKTQKKIVKMFTKIANCVLYIHTYIIYMRSALPLLLLSFLNKYMPKPYSYILPPIT